MSLFSPILPSKTPNTPPRSRTPLPTALIFHVLKSCRSDCTWRQNTFQHLPAHDEECHIQLTHSSCPPSAWSNISTVVLSASGEMFVSGLWQEKWTESSERERKRKRTGERVRLGGGEKKRERTCQANGPSRLAVSLSFSPKVISTSSKQVYHGLPHHK